MRRDVVCDVNDADFRVRGKNYSLDRTNEIVGIAKVGEERDKREVLSRRCGNERDSETR